jgi:hypothetical protein
MTIVASGVGRSGTSMIARVLDALGIPMGRTDGLAVFEDQEFLQSLLFFEIGRMQELIETRNASFDKWGFKFASIQNHLFPAQLSLFRNPRLIIVMRDAVATANRSHTSDPDKPTAEAALVNVAKQTMDIIDFVRNSACPTLLVSYEKAIIFPEETVIVLAEFCGIALTTERHAKAMAVIEPNTVSYINLFHSEYRGHFDGISDGKALGWCKKNDGPEKVELQIIANQIVVGTVLADIFREDLREAEIGDGCHAFSFDLSLIDLAPNAILQIRTADLTHYVDGGGQPIHYYIAPSEAQDSQPEQA